ncbi:MAG: DUF2298 domain-containing protein [Anaerolineales bacterium]|jgi:YYY domain-containing protein
MTNTHTSAPDEKWAWLYDLLLIGVLLIGAYFRFVGADWGQLQDQHPDENFMEGVTNAIQPVHSLAEYFNTDQSTLNPNKLGYVYGTLPLFLVRYLAQGLGQMGEVRLFGREMAAVSDLGTILLLYLIVARFYRRRVALLAAAFSAVAVMQIQQSHFYTTDSFVNFFLFLTLYCAALIGSGEWGARLEENAVGAQRTGFLASLVRLLHNRLLLLSAAFGVALGMATASKINAAVAALLLPAALAISYFKSHRREGSVSPAPDRQVAGRSAFEEFLGQALVYCIIGAVFSLLSFRIFQPYAFSGPGFFGLKLNANWIANIRSQLNEMSPNADLVWALQWARRGHLYSFQNLTVWGLGLPLGILAWAGVLWMGWRILKGGWSQHLLLWAWTAGYFIWQSLQWNATMRYQLPIYPLLAMMAAWFVFDLWDLKRSAGKGFKVGKVLAAVLGLSVLLLSTAWAYAFTRIYVHAEPRMAASDWLFQNAPGPINLRIQKSDGSLYNEPVPVPEGTKIVAGLPYAVGFTAHADGSLSQVVLEHLADVTSPAVPQTLSLFLLANSPNDPANQALASAVATTSPTSQGDPRGPTLTLVLDRSIVLKQDQTYYLRLETTGGALTLSGSNLINETDFDYPLPFRTAVYDPFGGIYPGGVNLQVYWDDNADKLTRFLSTLNLGDYILIPTNHQYGQITRIPERYPLTTVYYRDLIGCPPDKDIIWCYRVAEPGMFHGRLGFNLVATFEDYPTIGPLVINDQGAEEAFTFYDHPKVLIFQKAADYDPAKVSTLLGAVDLSNVVHLTPGQANTYKSLMLPADKLATQQQGGTWSQLFDWNALQNEYPGLGALIWYLVIFALGLVTYPLVRAALPGLADRGYPLARLVGLLLWAWFSWLAGSLGGTYSRLTIGLSLGLIVLIGALLAYRQREGLKQEWRTRKKYFLLVEGLFLTFFLIDLLIRLGNSDLWHPARGGERPMDFAYLNAILKSTTFPPYDPWFAGGYINYYYYGYVIVGTPVKLLGIVPAIAYNFILPTLYAMLAMGAFSVGWNLFAPRTEAEEEDAALAGPTGWRAFLSRSSFYCGLAAASAMVLLGNLGVVRMFYQGFQQLAAPGGLIDKAGILQRIVWAVHGFFLSLGGINLPYGPGDWYWNPSRVLPASSGSPITEFPLFTFIYSDLHAHMIAYPLTVLAIAWVLSVVLARAKWKGLLEGVLGLGLGALVIGSLYPTNTWDFYTYLLLASIVLVYTVWRYVDVQGLPLRMSPPAKRWILSLGAAALLAGLSLLFYQPYWHWYSQQYNSIQPWTGGRSDIWSYLTHWGVFLFFIVSWMIWETREWLASTPLSALRKLRPYQELILGAVLLLILLLVVQQVWVMLPTQNVPWDGVTILWLALPLAAWAGVLILRPGLSDTKRLVLFMVGTSLVLTMVVEILVVSGDVERMNTVFKFYCQAWIMLGISAAAAFGWLLGELRKWLPGWRGAWKVASLLLVAGGALFIVFGVTGKIQDRMALNAPHTLNSMTYMAYSQYSENGANMDLSQDYGAILWMQKNVQGSPVIVEAAAAGVQYTWFSRFSIYTGLPDVVGWQWHQQQQRVLFSDQVVARGVEEDAFYTTTDVQAAEAFLRKYNARYIIVGQLERAKYAGPGLDKFDQENGKLWKEVYQQGQTAIYQVLP